MRRSIALVLCLATVAVGLWLMNGSQTLTSACTFSAQTGGGNACVSGIPFFVLGMLLTASGVVILLVVLLTLIRARREALRWSRSTISTLHQHEIERLREVA